MMLRDALSPFPRQRLGKVRIHVLEDVPRVLWDVRPVFQPRAGGHDVVRGDLVADLDRCHAVEVVRHGLVPGRLADVGAADNRGSEPSRGVGKTNMPSSTEIGVRLLDPRVGDAGAQRVGEVAG